MIEVIVLIVILITVFVIGWLAVKAGPYLLGGAALYGATIALWNYAQAFAINVKPERPAP